MRRRGNRIVGERARGTVGFHVRMFRHWEVVENDCLSNMVIIIRRIIVVATVGHRLLSATAGAGLQKSTKNLDFPVVKPRS